MGHHEKSALPRPLANADAGLDMSLNRYFQGKPVFFVVPYGKSQLTSRCRRREPQLRVDPFNHCPLLILALANLSSRRSAAVPFTMESLSKSGIKIKLERPFVEELLTRYENLIGKDFPGYRNHVYRTITYAMHFLGNAEEHERLVQAAFVYHDIGLWTDRELAYLEPSEAVAIADNIKFGLGLDPELLRGAIHWHHKILPYSGPYREVIEACRKADWIDASKGMLRKGMSRSEIQRVEAAFPNLGFHETLLRLAKDYGGSIFVGGIKVTLGIVKW